MKKADARPLFCLSHSFYAYNAAIVTPPLSCVFDRAALVRPLPVPVFALLFHGGKSYDRLVAVAESVIADKFRLGADHGLRERAAVRKRASADISHLIRYVYARQRGAIAEAIVVPTFSTPPPKYAQRRERQFSKAFSPIFLTSSPAQKA